MARRELDSASADLRAARRAAHDLPGISAELQTAKGAAATESRRVAELQAELQASRHELEETVGKLKYAEQEQRSLARKIGSNAMTEEQKQLAAAQEEAAVVSAQLVSEVCSKNSSPGHTLPGERAAHPTHPQSDGAIRWPGARPVQPTCTLRPTRSLPVWSLTRRTPSLAGCCTTTGTSGCTQRRPPPCGPAPPCGTSSAPSVPPAPSSSPEPRRARACAAGRARSAWSRQCRRPSRQSLPVKRAARLPRRA